jgi:dTDP-4-dehydrorhamnose reductase
MRVTIIGAAGLLGKYLLREWTTDEVRGVDLPEVDIRDPRALGRVIGKARPHWTVLTAAHTDVDGCESQPDLAMETNCRGAVNVAEAARRQGARLMFISTDYVFDGRKATPYETDDQRNPRSVYGRSKAEAEVGITRVLPESCIVRTSWLFGVGGKCFPDTILKLATTRPELEVVNDQRGCPTYARDLTRAIVQLCRANAEGTVHATNRGDCTWFEFASEIVRQAGAKAVIRPTTSEKFVRPAERPKYSVLSSKSLEQRHIHMPRWQEAVRDYLVERGNLSACQLEAGRCLSFSSPKPV